MKVVLYRITGEEDLPEGIRRETAFSGCFPGEFTAEEVLSVIGRDAEIPGLAPREKGRPAREIAAIGGEKGGGERYFFRELSAGAGEQPGPAWEETDAIPENISGLSEAAGCVMVVLLPGERPYSACIKEDLATLQRAAGGFIEITYPFPDNAMIIGNEEAKLIGLPGNRRINGEIYAGPLLIAGDDYLGGFRDLTSAQVKRFFRQFAEPETFTPGEVENSMEIRFFAC